MPYPLGHGASWQGAGQLRQEHRSRPKLNSRGFRDGVTDSLLLRELQGLEQSPQGQATPAQGKHALAAAVLPGVSACACCALVRRPKRMLGRSLGRGRLSGPGPEEMSD